MSAVLDLLKAPLMKVDDVAIILRVKDLARRAIHHGWLKPCVYSGTGGSASPLYCRRDVDALVARIVAGEIPPVLPSQRRKGEVPE